MACRTRRPGGQHRAGCEGSGLASFDFVQGVAEQVVELVGAVQPSVDRFGQSFLNSEFFSCEGRLETWTHYNHPFENPLITQWLFPAFVAFLGFSAVTKFARKNAFVCIVALLYYNLPTIQPNSTQHGPVQSSLPGGTSRFVPLDPRSLPLAQPICLRGERGKGGLPLKKTMGRLQPPPTETTTEGIEILNHSPPFPLLIFLGHGQG